MVLVAKNEVTLTNIFDGKKGDTGEGVTVVKTEYAYSNSANTQPQSGWVTTLPTASKGSYLWTRVTYSDKTSVVTNMRKQITHHTLFSSRHICLNMIEVSTHSKRH